MRRRRICRALVSLVFLSALGIVAGFATGKLSYVTTHGVSMLPAFHTGDLVILRAAGAYHVGQIVAYRSTLLHTTVLHRIVAEHNGVFSFKGDHNPWVDPEHLTSSSIKGTLLLHIPHGGLYLSWLASPTHAVFPAAIALSVIALVRARRRATLSTGRRVAREISPGRLTGNWLLLAGALGTVLLGTLALVAFGAPTSRSSEVAVPYTEHLDFTYAGSATRGAVYPTGSVTTGEPVFVKLVHALEVRATYRLTGAGVTRMSGTIAFDATVVEADGWSHNLVVSPPTPFEGSLASVAVAVPVERAVALVERAAVETGIGYGGQSIVLTPTVSVRGTIAGQNFAQILAPSLTFEMSPLELNLLAASQDVSGPKFPQLQSMTTGTVHRAGVTPGELTLFGHHLDVKTARLAGTMGLALALALIVAGLAQSWRRRATSEEERTRCRVARDLVPIETDPTGILRTVVDVSTMTALADLAERFDVALLDYHDGDEHSYFAEIGGILYCYRHAPAPPHDGDDAEVIPLPHVALYSAPTEPSETDTRDEGHDAEVIPLPKVALYVSPEGALGIDEDELGLNAWFAEEKRREFLENPSSVPASWREYFGGGEGASLRANAYPASE